MADLHPIPFGTLAERLLREVHRGEAVFGIARRDWWEPDPGCDLSHVHHGRRIGSPAGPAAGPHTQLAQNLVMAWLAGGRFFELKTVQVDDDLAIPRPCIDVPHVGWNVEWSQELRVPESAREYAKGWVLVHLLAERLGREAASTFDLSLGYDLGGIRSEKVGRFLAWMAGEGGAVEALLDELPEEVRPAVPARISDSVTISTFHGCPREEVEAIARQTLEWGWHTTLKLNPTLLGYARCRERLDRLGYSTIALRPDDFARDLTWEGLLEMVPRLLVVAAGRGLGFGVKFSNTLVSWSAETPLSAASEMYLSGPPLHVLALELGADFRAAFPGVPITFSAGVDAENFSECVAAGLGPVTACSDLLKGRGIARMVGYLRGLERRMAEAGAADLAGWRALAGVSVRGLFEGAREDARYARGANRVPPRKVGSKLHLLDCLTCDKCIPVCPNGANFAIPVARGEHRPGRLAWKGGAFSLSEGDALVVARRHQIGNVADACNRCGQCDTWCPEDGGPHLVKPTVFLSEASFAAHPDRDGFLVDGDREGIRWRRSGRVVAWRRLGEGEAVLTTPSGSVRLQGDRPVATEGEGELDLVVATTMRLLLDGFRAEGTEAWLLPPRYAPPAR